VSRLRCLSSLTRRWDFACPCVQYFQGIFVSDVSKGFAQHSFARVLTSFPPFAVVVEVGALSPPLVPGSHCVLPGRGSSVRGGSLLACPSVALNCCLACFGRPADWLLLAMVVLKPIFASNGCTWFAACARRPSYKGRCRITWRGCWFRCTRCVS
jgi:hypothetical protein